MQFTVLSAVFLVLAAFVAENDAIFSGGIGIGAGALLAGAIGVKALAGFGLLLASRKGRGGRGGRKGGRYGRSVISVEDIPNLINEASLEDEGDCAKKFVCEVHAKAFAALDEVEQGIYQLFGGKDVIDVASESVQFDLAAMVGRRAGFQQCQKVYGRCDMTNEQLKTAMRQ